MKIVKLTAENIKRLRAVEITPDGNTVVISGRNGQGKTSVLDAIWFALGGGPATRDTAKPIRDGQDHASVTLDLGDIRVSRTWVGDKTTLKVESADGARYSSPQQMLDGLVGSLSFDPLAFSNLPEREQLATLLKLVDLPFDVTELDRRRRTLYEDRTAIGRDGKQYDGQLAGMPQPAPDLPDKEISTAAVLADYRRAQEAYRLWSDASSRVKHAQEELAAAEFALGRLDEPTGHAPTAIEEQIAGIEETNRQVRAARERTRVAERVAEHRALYEDLTAEITALDDQKAAALHDASMPIDGLAFDDDVVTYNRVPFKQCSAAEQLRVSLAMAMAMNPTIRVIRITDGSLLDAANMELIEKMAVEGDYQCWIERVADRDEGVGVFIEDGAVSA